MADSFVSGMLEQLCRESALQKFRFVFTIAVVVIGLMLIWFPFGKLMHAFYLAPSRAINAYALGRKGGAS